jgi:hypothetical protein
MTAEERAQLHAMLPQGIARVRVTSAEGKQYYKAVPDILDTDTVDLTAAGKPIVMRNTPGRPVGSTTKPMLPPVSKQAEEVSQAKDNHEALSDLVSVTKQNSEADAVFHTLMNGLAVEITSLEFERREAERKGEDTSNISSKRVRAIKTMTDAWLKKREKVDSGTIDLEGVAFKTLFAFTLETVRGAMGDSGMRPEHIETVFAKLSKRLADGWAEDAKARMREATK